MKTNRPSRSAYVHFRIFLAFTLCLAGVSLAVNAFGAWTRCFFRAWVSAQKSLTAHESEDKNRKIERVAKGHSSGGAKWSGQERPPPTGGAMQPDRARQIPSKQTKPPARTVYTISPPNSKFLRRYRAGRNSLPRGPRTPREEPKLPPGRISLEDPTRNTGCTDSREPRAPRLRRRHTGFISRPERCRGVPAAKNARSAIINALRWSTRTIRVALNSTTKTATRILGPFPIITCL